MMKHLTMSVRNIPLDVNADVYRAYDGELEVDIGGIRLKGNRTEIYEIVGGDVLDEIVERIKDAESEEAKKLFKADQEEPSQAS